MLQLLTEYSVVLNHNAYDQIIGMVILWQDNTTREISIFSELYIEVVIGRFKKLEGKLIPPELLSEKGIIL